MTELIDDTAEWKAALEGDGRAFGLIYDRHSARLRRHAFSVASSAADVDDIVAIAFLEAWRRRASVRFVDNSLLPWLLVTATNASHNLSRSARRYRALLDRLPAPTVHDTPGGGEAEDALRRMSLPDQQILTLSVVLGLTEPEVAEVLGIARGTVKSRLSRAKRRLAERVSPAHIPNNRIHKESLNGNG